jgi:tetratricopeptide (TPR) repeat protein
MFNLIVPPIIIVLAIAGLVIFLSRVVPRSDEKIRAKELKKIDNKEKEIVLDDAKSISNTDDNLSKENPKKKRSKFRSIFSSFKFSKSKRQIKKNRTTLPKSEQIDGVSMTVKQPLTVQNTKNKSENLSRMGEILMNNNGVQGNSENDEEAELVRQISVNPRSPESYRRLGDFYVENNRLRDARECYKYVLRLNPRHKRAQLAMRRLDRILG